MADGSVAQFRFFGKLQLAESKLFSKKLNLETDKVLLKFDTVARELGYEFSALEMIRSPITYSDKDGNTVIFNSFYCSDPERIENEEAIFYSEVFDPKSADSIQEAEINGAKAILCTMDAALS